MIQPNSQHTFLCKYTEVFGLLRKKNNKYIQGLCLACHHRHNTALPVFYSDNVYVLSMSYFESSWANSIESQFHALCVRRWEPLTAPESIVHISTWTRLRYIAYHPPYFSSIVFSVYSLYGTSPRALSTAPGESDRICQRHLFRGGCQHQLCINLLRDRARNANKPCGRRSVKHPTEVPNGTRRKNNHAFAFIDRRRIQPLI